MELDLRQKNLFRVIAEEFIRTAKPVGSEVLAKKHGVHVSPATIRNELHELEEKGFLTHPHTSAGRVLTEKGYRYYLENFFKETDLKEEEKKAFRRERSSPKQVAKFLADFSVSAVMVGFSKDDFYYTGLTHLFSQPEFSQMNLILNIASVVDHLDQVMETLYRTLGEPAILLGKENPFSHICGMVGARCGEQIIAMVGPIRMDYPRNMARIKFLKQLYE